MKRHAYFKKSDNSSTCGGCGTLNSSNSKFCLECGVLLNIDNIKKYTEKLK